MKPNNVPNLFPAGTVMNANLSSTPQQVYNVFSMAIQIVFTGTPTGAFKLQASSDAAFSSNPAWVSSPTHWTDVDSSSQSVSAAGSIMYNVVDPGYNWIRIVYTDGSSGSSTAVITSATFNGKGF